MINWLHHLFTTVVGWVGSPKAKAALAAVEAEIEKLLPVAIEIVTEIAALAPSLGDKAAPLSKVIAELNTIATKYALPTITALESGQTAGNVALNLGTQILQKNHAPNAAVSLLNTVIQFAVTLTKAKASIPAA
jgi:hypothetical protein